MDNEKKSYYAIIPAKVRYDKKIPIGARMLYGEITALCNQLGYCYASNKYFAELYEVKIRTIQRWIEFLEKRKFIKVEIVGLKRKIFIMEEITYNKCNDDGEIIEEKKKSKLPKTRKDVVAKQLQTDFKDMAKRILKVDVINDNAGYVSVLRVMNQHDLSADQIKKMFSQWFGSANENYVSSITACLANRNVEKFKLQNGIKAK